MWYNFSMKNVLITGGSGSLGKEICKSLLNETNIKKILILSRNEKQQLDMKWEIKDDRVEYVIGDIRDYSSIYKYLINVDEVYHAAAMKHIDIAEENPIETTNINVLGTINVINSSIQNNVKKMLFISTDKASSPSGIYGATKLLAEKNVLLSNKYSSTKFSVVRFGNLIGSSGSIFQKWSSNDIKTINLTDKDVTRFFIKISEAAKFCTEVMEILDGNELFIYKMKSAKVYDIAKHYANDKNIFISGLRKNEKIHEDIISKIDFGTIYEYDKYYKIIPDGKQNNFEYNSKNNNSWYNKEDIDRIVNNE